MTNSENLLQRITRIAETGTTYDQGRRVLANDNNDAILPAILQEIDETILARELTFHNDAGQSISLIAKGRRLWQICEAKPQSLIPKGADLLSVNLSGDDAANMAALAKLIDRFATAAKTLSVSIAETEPGSDYTAMGIAVPVLREAWNVAATPPQSPEQDPFQDPVSLLEFVETLSGDILASALLDGDKMISSSGSDKQIKLLENLIKEQIPGIDADLKKLKNKGNGKSLIALNRDIKYFIICARMENQTALIVCKPDKLPGIVSNWQQLDA